MREAVSKGENYYRENLLKSKGKLTKKKLEANGRRGENYKTNARTPKRKVKAKRVAETTSIAGNDRKKKRLKQHGRETDRE